MRSEVSKVLQKIEECKVEVYSILIPSLEDMWSDTIPEEEDVYFNDYTCVDWLSQISNRIQRFLALRDLAAGVPATDHGSFTVPA